MRLSALIGLSILLPATGFAQQPAVVSPAVETLEAGAVMWLTQQMVPNAAVTAPESARRRMLLSYRVSPDDPVYRYIYGRSAIYDDAIGAIAFTMTRRYKEAEYVLSAITRLVGPDGSLWFAYNTQNDWPSASDHEGGIVRTGAIAWVGYALTYYLQARGLETPDFVTKDALGIQFRKSAEAIAQYVLARQVASGTDPRSDLVTGGTGSSIVTLPESSASPQEAYSGSSIQWVSTEHNIDAWYFLRDLGRLTATARYAEAAERIRLRLLDLWSGKDGQFYQGIHDDRTIDVVLPLDAASWGALFLLSQGRSAQAVACIDVMASRFGVGTTALRGFRPYGAEPVHSDPRVNSFYYPKGGGLWSDLPLVWGEGSLGAAAAYIRAGRAAEGTRVIESMAALAVDGGIRYASVAVPYQFSDYPSVASTAWLVIAAEMLRGTPTGNLFWSK